MRLLKLLLPMLFISSGEILPAQAQESADDLFMRMVGTVSTSAVPYRSEGKLDGCTLVFNLLVRDTAYDLGAYLKVAGTTGVFLNGKGAVGTLKLSVEKLSFSLKSGMVSEPRRPSRAYLILSDFSTTLEAGAETLKATDPANLLVGFSGMKAVEVGTEIVRTKKIQLGFNQADGKNDIIVPIEFDIVTKNLEGGIQRSDAAVNSYSDCLAALSDRL
ncbi:MAG: hypothetical protein JNM45_17240 [Rhizobiales bacterium]|nr:hypothetical protein [Hyphomicrobiales bacterium]